MEAVHGPLWLWLVLMLVARCDYLLRVERYSDPALVTAVLDVMTRLARHSRQVAASLGPLLGWLLEHHHHHPLTVKLNRLLLLYAAGDRDSLEQWTAPPETVQSGNIGFWLFYIVELRNIVPGAGRTQPRHRNPAAGRQLVQRQHLGGGARGLASPGRQEQPRAAPPPARPATASRCCSAWRATPPGQTQRPLAVWVAGCSQLQATSWPAARTWCSCFSAA